MVALYIHDARDAHVLEFLAILLIHGIEIITGRFLTDLDSAHGHRHLKNDNIRLLSLARFSNILCIVCRQESRHCRTTETRRQDLCSCRIDNSGDSRLRLNVFDADVCWRRVSSISRR